MPSAPSGEAVSSNRSASAAATAAGIGPVACTRGREASATVGDDTPPGRARWGDADSARRATVEVLERLGHEVVFPDQQTCCGQLHVNSGYRSEALGLAHRFARV